MATPTFLRYLPARLKPLSSPAVWAPLTVFGLLSAFIWEYHNNPDWFNRPQISNVNPDSTLTPEEQARISEIDTLELLLQQNARVPEAAKLQNEANGLLGTESPNDPAAEVLTPDRNLAGRDNPFAAYEEQYKFPGAQNAAAAQASATAASASAGSPSFSSGLNTSRETPSAVSALSEALNRQQSARSGLSNDGAESMSSSNSAAGISAPNRETLNTESTGSESLGTSTFRPSNAAPNDISGSGLRPSSGSQPFANPEERSGNRLSEPFIRTTTDMSPPVGTTGYQAPASVALPTFNVPPQQPTRNPFQQPTNLPASAISTPAAPNSLPALSAPNQAGSNQPGSQPPTFNYTAPSFTQPEQNRRR